MKEFTVTILGSSAALPYKNRNLTSQVVNHAGRHFLIDCGEGTQMQLQKLRIRSMRINHIFISHLHGDHFYGLIGLISTFHLLGRKESLHIYGPPALESVIRLQLEVSATSLVYELVFHSTQSGYKDLVYEDELLRVWSFPMVHRIPTTGFLFSEKPYARHIDVEAAARYGVTYSDFPALRIGEDYRTATGEVIANALLTKDPGAPRSYAFCADTLYHGPVADLVKGCSLLYHEATFMQDKASIAKEKLHSTAAEAADIALKAEAGRLLIGHFSARYKNLQPLLDEARTVFPETWLAEDGTTYTV